MHNMLMHDAYAAINMLDQLDHLKAEVLPVNKCSLVKAVFSKVNPGQTHVSCWIHVKE